MTCRQVCLKSVFIGIPQCEQCAGKEWIYGKFNDVTIGYSSYNLNNSHYKY